jgi:aryl-alcohol dehydrogenase-like predicted oxidoreductase
MDYAFDHGINCFDTAHLYANGEADRLIGRWMEGRHNREQMVILAKGCHHNEDRRRVTPFDLTADLYDTLARMKTESIDLYILHRDDPAVPVGPIVETLHGHREAGRIKAYGGSNWTWQRLQEANDYAAAHGLHPFVVSSQHFSLAEQVRDPWGGGCVSVAGPKEEVARQWHRQHNIPLFAYASLSGGLFSGRFTRDTFESERDAGHIDGACVRAYCYEDNFERLERAQKLAASRGLTVPQVAIAYVLAYAEYDLLDTHALVGAGSVSELQADLGALDVNLTPEEMAWLDLTTDRAPQLI